MRLNNFIAFVALDDYQKSKYKQDIDIKFIFCKIINQTYYYGYLYFIVPVINYI